MPTPLASRKVSVICEVIGVLLASLAILGGVAIVGIQSFGWLKSGQWSKFSIRDFIAPNHPITDWIGFQSIIDWFLDASLAATWFGTLTIASFVMFRLGNERRSS